MMFIIDTFTQYVHTVNIHVYKLWFEYYVNNERFFTNNLLAYFYIYYSFNWLF